MKVLFKILLAACFVATSLQAYAQGVMVYDQQSATAPISPFANNTDGLDIQEDAPVQSFVPALSTIGFVQLEFQDIPDNGNNGATVYVKLYTGSPNVNLSSATLLGSTAPVYMPNGFENNNLGLAGVTTFDFSTPIALTPGQTYYLDPVVQSGDNPWDVITIGDTYPNGQVFESGDGFSTDFWFREGGLVPEPTTLALFGLVGIIVLIYRHRKMVLPFIGLFLVTSAYAQTYYLQSYGGVGSLPWPVNPLGSSVPVYEVSTGVYLVEDGAPSFGRFHSMTTMSLSGPPSPGGTNGSGTNIFQPSDFVAPVFTNGLWLQALNTNGTTTNFVVRAHNTVNGNNFQLLSTSSLPSTNWNLGQILSSTNDSYMDFSPVSMTNPMTFYRVHQANPIINISDGLDSQEPNPTNSDPGAVGNVRIQTESPATNIITVYYSIGGTAQNGVDYSNITGSVTFAVGQSESDVAIAPIADGLKPNQTIILTLIQNSNYLIEPLSYSATNILLANPQVYPIANGDRETLCPNMLKSFQLSASSNGPSLSYTIVTSPAHGTLDTSSLPYVTYASTNCYEGVDSFTFTAYNGQFTSTPATVEMIVSDPVSGFSGSAQTCRATPVSVPLNGLDNCSETLSYAVSSGPLHGTVTNTTGDPTTPNFIYTPTGTNFTGTDSFNFTVSTECGDTAVNTVTITVGAASIQATAQTALTGTNRPVSITLSAADSSDDCFADTNYFTYTLTSLPAHGTLSGAPPNVTYTPTNGFEGQDSFTFTANDGTFSSSTPATVTVDVVAGLLLFHDCNPFGTAVRLDWFLDSTEQALFADISLTINDFVIYRSSVSGSDYTAIATNTDGGDTNGWFYLDTNAVVGETNYYVVTFETSPGFTSGNSDASPFSNEVGASAQNPSFLLAADAFWTVATNLSNPTSVTNLQAPFSSYGTNQYYPGLSILPNTLWPVGSTWSNHTTIVIPTNIPLSQVSYSIAIDNNYRLYINDSTVPYQIFNHEGDATWSAFKAFNTSNTSGPLHYGTNDIGVVIVDETGVNYFSMIVSDGACVGQ